MARLVDSESPRRASHHAADTSYTEFNAALINRADTAGFKLRTSTRPCAIGQLLDRSPRHFRRNRRVLIRHSSSTSHTTPPGFTPLPEQGLPYRRRSMIELFGPVMSQSAQAYEPLRSSQSGPSRKIYRHTASEEPCHSPGRFDPAAGADPVSPGLRSLARLVSTRN